MSDRFEAFTDSFRSIGLSEAEREQLWALADYTTNTLRVFHPADDPIGMTIVHALNSREEFMHGEWSVAIIHTAARLRLAAIEALYELLEDPHCDRRAELFDVVYGAWTTADRLDEVVEPFQEAVDKFQILSVIHDDEQFLESVEATFDAIYGDELGDVDIRRRLERERDNQHDIVRGKRTVDRSADESLYVNPLYYFALLEAATVDRGRLPDDTAAMLGDIDRLSERRTIAETVARVTLDVPFPLAPLGPTATTDALRVEGLDVDSLSFEDLHTQSGAAERYAVSDSEYERYLLRHADRIDHDGLRARLGTTIEEYDPTWLDAVFVTTLQALEDLAAEVDVTTLDTSELRRRLSRRVHGMDPDTTTTMLDRPTHLLDIPAKAGTDADSQDTVGVETGPVPKMIVEAFEQHGSFGAVVFRPTKGTNNYQLNYHALDADGVAAHPDVPAGVDSYRDLWTRYFFGKEMVNTLFSQYNDYVETIIDCFLGAYDSDRELVADLRRVSPRVATALSEAGADGAGGESFARRTNRPSDSPGPQGRASERSADSVSIRRSQSGADADVRRGDGETAPAPIDGSEYEPETNRFADLTEKEPLEDQNIPLTEIDADERADDSDGDIAAAVPASGSRARPDSDGERVAMRARLEQWSLLGLRTAARELDLDVPPVEAVATGTLDCPLCDIGTEPCGGTGCVTTTQREQFDTHLETLIEGIAREAYAADPT